MKATAVVFITLSHWAWAEQGAAAPMGMKQGMAQFVPILLIFFIFYFMIIRPQQKKAKTHQQFLTDLKRGDMVVTQSGIIGTVKQLGERIVTLEVDEGVCLKVVRGQISENANNLKEDNKSKQEEKR